MTTNFWYYLIVGVVYGFAETVGIRLPPHQYWGMAEMVVGYTGEILVIILLFLGTFINLKTLGLVGGMILSIKMFKWIASNAPALLGLVAKIAMIFA